MKYRKKPVVVEATQWFKKGDHPMVFANDDGTHEIWTLEGNHQVTPGDWIITGVKGEYYPCKPDIFAMTYELATTLDMQYFEDILEAAYWQFDCRRSGLNEWAKAPQSERDAFKAEARKLMMSAAAQEREQCAQLVEPTADHLQNPWHYLGGDEGVELLIELAQVIRSRGEP